MANRWRNNGNSERLYFLVFQNHCRWWFQPLVKRRSLLGRKALTNLDNIFKIGDLTLPTEVWIVKAMVFLIVVYGYESWTIKKAECWRTEVYKLCCWRRQKTLESPLGCKGIKPVNPKGDQPWIFMGRTDAEAEALILWPPDAKSWLTRKDLTLGKIEGRRRGQHRMRWLDGIIKSIAVGMSKLQEKWRTG